MAVVVVVGGQDGVGGGGEVGSRGREGVFDMVVLVLVTVSVVRVTVGPGLTFLVVV